MIRARSHLNLTISPFPEPPPITPSPAVTHRKRPRHGNPNPDRLMMATVVPGLLAALRRRRAISRRRWTGRRDSGVRRVVASWATGRRRCPVRTRRWRSARVGAGRRRIVLLLRRLLMRWRSAAVGRRCTIGLRGWAASVRRLARRRDSAVRLRRWRLGTIRRRLVRLRWWRRPICVLWRRRARRRRLVLLRPRRLVRCRRRLAAVRARLARVGVAKVLALLHEFCLVSAPYIHPYLSSSGHMTGHGMHLHSGPGDVRRRTCSLRRP